MRILLIWIWSLAFCGANNFTQVNRIKNVPADVFKTQLATTRQAILIDVRTPEEFALGHLADAVNLNFYAPDFPVKLQQLSAGKMAFIYCAVGGRSTKAVAYLKDLGPTPVYHLNGGITAWQKAGYPVVK